MLRYAIWSSQSLACSDAQSEADAPPAERVPFQNEGDPGPGPLR